jgi:hypothetical protein
MSIIAAGITGKHLLRVKPRRPSRIVTKRYSKLHAFLERRINEDLYPKDPDAGHTCVTHEVLEHMDKLALPRRLTDIAMRLPKHA